MLQRLHIQNYAIIDDLSINFSDQLNIITGETGAGKSILMGALNLILGQRADCSVLYSSDKKCIVEGVFQIKSNQALQYFFTTNELDFESELLVRREISSNGKSRSFINDTPVNLSQVKALGILLVDLHQQFDTLDINSENFQREVLDAFADNGPFLLELSSQFDSYTKTKKLLDQLIQQQSASNKELDYNRFLFDELEELSLKENELELLDAELKILNNAENIKQQLSAVNVVLKESDQPIVQQLKVLQQKLKALEQYHTDIEPITKRLASSTIELQDISDELEQLESKVHLDDQRVSIINERLSSGYKLLKKHGVQETAQLIAIHQSLQEKLQSVLNVASSIESLEKEQTKLYDACLQTASKISSNRQGQIKSFVSKVNQLLAQVGMPNAEIKVQLTPAPLTAVGIDDIAFLFDANKSNRFEPLSKVASGGELSRLMLSIKSLVAQKLSLPTLIFDEIDTGISGEAAKQVGIIMKSLSTAHQLIAITHQPQIAAMAYAHYFVYKESKEGKITTGVKLLNNEERITAIAKMLSGEKPTAAALANAKEMIGLSTKVDVIGSKK